MPGIADWIWKIFGGIGMAACALVLMAAVIATYETCSELVHDARWNYKYKHRFDKKPVAKCYCKDCYYYTKNGKCENVTWADRYTPDNGFCYDASPMTAKEAKKRGQ